MGCARGRYARRAPHFIAFALAGVLALAGLSFFVGTPAAYAADTTDVSVNVTYGQTTARGMLTSVNSFRTGNDANFLNSSGAVTITVSGLGDLTYDYTLEKIAMQRAAEIALSFSHTRPDGTSCYTAFDGYSGYTAVGENIAAGQTTADAAFTSWLEADATSYSGQGHRRNMLGGVEDNGTGSGYTSDNFNAIGIGHVYVNGTHYWVQEFGTTTSPNTTATTAVDTAQDVSVSVASGQVIGSATLTASSSSLRVAVGSSVSLPTLTASFKLANTWSLYSSNISATVTDPWTSSDTSVATVSSDSVTGVSIGNTTLTATALGQTASVSVAVTAPDVDISSYTLIQTADLTYTGSTLTPVCTLTDSASTVVDSSKYDLKVYSDSACTNEVTSLINAGTYYVKATAKSGSGYTGTTTTAASFAVAPKAVTISGVSAKDKTYDGTTDAAITGTAALSGVLSSDTVSLDNTNAKASFADANAGEDKTVTFSGYALTSTDAANYTLSAQPASTTASITQKEITVTIANIADQTYTGSQITPTVSVSSTELVSGDSLTLGTDYTVSYGTNTTVAQGGTVSVSPVDGSNYIFDTASATFNIIKANATTTTEPAATNPTYTGSAQALVIEGETSDGTIYYRLETGDNTYTDWSTTVPTATNAGSYTVEYYVAGDANHNDSAAQTISASINKATYTGTISGSLAVATNTAATYTYDFASQLSGIDGAAIKSTENTSDPDYIIGYFDGNNTTVTVTTKSVSDENKTATIRVGFESTNYNNFFATLTLTTKNKGDAGVTLSGAPTSLTYGDADFTLTATAANTGANGTWTWTSSDSDTLQVTQDSSNPNKATVKALAANTTGTTITASYSSDTTEGSAATASLAVGKKALTITGVSAANKTYDGTTDATITGTAALSGVLTGDTVSLDSTNASASFADKNAGANKTVTFSGYTLTGTDAANYTLTQPTAKATISPKEITPVWDTSYAYTKTYDGTKAAGSVAQLDVPSGAACTGETLMLAGDSSTTYQFNSENVSEANKISVSVQLLIDESSSGTPSYGTTNNYVLAGYEGTVKVGDTTYYTYTHTGSITKAASSLTTTPAAKTDLVYTGSAQELVTAGTASGGSVVYRYKLSMASDWSVWSTELPAAMNAGTYDIEYKVAGDANHNDTTAQAISATISPSGTAPNAPSEYNPSYTVTTLAGVDLPAGWEWVDSSTALAVGETVTAKAKYVGEDAGNYATTEVDVKVTRSACTHPMDKQETRNAKDATCADAGYTGDTYCAQCGGMTAKGSTIIALGHSFTNYVSNDDATCTTDGTKTAKCDRCSVTDTITDAGSALGHSYVWKSDDSQHWQVCSRCDDKIDVAAHTFTTVIDKAATATEAGFKHEQCSVCGYRLESVTIPATGSDTDSSADSSTNSSSTTVLAETGDTTVPFAATAFACALAAFAAAGFAIRKNKVN